ncbi:MAG TPA: sugar phosphate isomerase/epimerase [Verrucomicrobiae bacterium]|jgi:sugar phosphate isomerase/epimerase
MNIDLLSRRSFVKAAAVVGATLTNGLPVARAAAPRKRNIKLGLDNFSVRGMKWNARQLVDYAAKLRCDTVFITDLGPFDGKHDDASLRDVRKYAADYAVEIILGSWSICPTSKSFKKDWGTAEEHLALGIRMAKALGSPAFRVVLGRQDDRLTEGGIEARIADTVKVLKSQRSRAVDAGVKIAVENHSGDMQSWELVTLIESAGKDYVGANIDSGNACWTLEDPVANLEILAPYVITTSLRDTMLWESANGVTGQWTAMGDGCVDQQTYFDIFEKRCPGVAVNIETISGFAREFPIYKPEFWRIFPTTKAEQLARFLALAKKGHAIEPFKAPAGVDKDKAQQDYQREQIERSIRYCKEALGLGVAA